MVVTVEQHATDAGVAVLEAGGNAVDAAVAVGFALAVTHPGAGNLGGGGFMLVRLADGTHHFIDFRERAPSPPRATCIWTPPASPREDSVVGYRAAGVPGTVRGFEYAWKKYRPQALGGHGGARRWNWPKKASRSPYGSEVAARAAERWLRFPESKRIFLRDGKPYEAGETFVQPDLARTLERIEEQGAKDFYEGETAPAGRGYARARRPRSRWPI
jgi:gamma-glutamyltranspeptidase / glutathione hydrolase